MSWLISIASADGISLAEAASWLVRNEVTISAMEWSALDAKERASLTAARIEWRAERLRDEGRDLAAAMESACIDGGASAARLMAKAAMEGVADARVRARG